MQARTLTQPVINSAAPFSLPLAAAPAADPSGPNGPNGTNALNALNAEAALLLREARNAAFSEVANGRLGRGMLNSLLLDAPGLQAVAPGS